MYARAAGVERTAGRSADFCGQRAARAGGDVERFHSREAIMPGLFSLQVLVQARPPRRQRFQECPSASAATQVSAAGGGLLAGLAFPRRAWDSSAGRLYLAASAAGAAFDE